MNQENLVLEPIARLCIKCKESSVTVPFVKGTNTCKPCRSVDRKKWDAKYYGSEKGKVSKKVCRKGRLARVYADPVKKKKHNQTRNIANKRWKDANREKVNAENREYKKANPHIINEQRMRRRARLEQGSISIADPKELREVYKKCTDISEQTGEIYQVDHIIPLLNDNVCGLHVPANLQVISKADNLKKSNKFDGTYENESWK